MVRRTASHLALAFMLAASPALAEDNFLLADASSSKSRAEVRHDTSDDSATEITSARSKARRATRHDTAVEDTVVASQNRGKRSRRTPGAEDLSAPMLAATDGAPAGLIALAANAELMAARVTNADFSGEAGALAVYQLIGKSLADLPLTDVEKQALTVAMDGADFAWLVADTEARLIAAAAEGEALEDIAEALGVPRPVATPGWTPNLGASLRIQSEVSPG